MPDKVSHVTSTELNMKYQKLILYTAQNMCPLIDYDVLHGEVCPIRRLCLCTRQEEHDLELHVISSY